MTDKAKIDLTMDPVGSTLLHLSIPMVFGMMGLALFNIVDAYFVGKLGPAELAAMSFTLPVVMLVGSLAMGLGVGASSIVSRSIGAGDTDRVRRLTTDTLLFSLLLALLITAIGIVTVDPLFTFLGADAEVLPLISNYMTIWYGGSVPIMLLMVSSSVIRASGDTKVPSIVLLVAAAINIGLDPILIFGVGPFPRLELAGAALASVIARTLTCVVMLAILHIRDRQISFALPGLATLWRSWKEVLYVGLPISAASSLVAVSAAIVIRIISGFGPDAVAATGIATRIESFTMLAIGALVSTLGPFVGQNWGAQKYDRAELSLRYGFGFSLAWGLALAALLALVGRPLAGIFTDDPDVISITALYFLIVPLSFAFEGVSNMVATVLPVLNKPMHAAALTLVQSFVFYVPLAYIGAELFDIKGVFGAVAISFVLSGTVAWLVLKALLPRLMESDYLERAAPADDLGAGSESFSYWIAQLELHARRHFDDKLQQLGLDRSTLAALTALLQFDDITVEELADRLCVHPKVAVRQVAALRRAGYLNPGRGRLELSEKARGAAPQVRSVLLSWDDILSEGLSREERQTLLYALRQLNDRALGATANLPTTPPIGPTLQVGAVPIMERSAL